MSGINLSSEKSVLVYRGRKLPVRSRCHAEQVSAQITALCHPSWHRGMHFSALSIDLETNGLVLTLSKDVWRQTSIFLVLILPFWTFSSGLKKKWANRT